VTEKATNLKFPTVIEYFSKTLNPPSIDDMNDPAWFLNSLGLALFCCYI